MKKLIATWIAVVFAIAACISCATAPVVQPPTVFEQVCLKAYVEYEVTCSLIEEPEVRDTLLVNLIGSLGITIYEDNTIYIAKELLNLPGMTRDDIIYHEMVHWVLRKAGTLTTTDRCESERVARVWTAARAGVEVRNWQPDYGCTYSIPSEDAPPVIGP